MTSSKLTRRELISGMMKGAFSIPFALSPMGQFARAQPSSTNAPLRFITITLPYSPRTETNDGSNGDDNFIRIMWDQFPESVRPYTRFFSNFSYNITDTGNWHGFGGFSHLFTCNPLSSDRANPWDQPRTVSMDYEIASLMGDHFSPYANMQTSAGGPIQNRTMPMTLLSHKPYWGEYTGSDTIYYAPTTGAGVFDANTNFGCYLTYRPDGTVQNPLYPNSANAYSSIFGVQTGNGEVLPETGLEQVLRIIHDSDIANFISDKQIQSTEQSHEKILDLQTRIQRHQDFLAAQQNPPSQNACSEATSVWPGVNAHHNERNAYNFEAIKHMINCDLHRVINFSFTDADAAGMEPMDANGLNNTNIPGHSNIEFHNATHREVGGIQLNNERMKSIYDYYYGQVGSLLNDLQQMEDPLAPSGSGQSVLDNTIIYITGTTGFPDVHSANDMAIAVVGGGRQLDNGSHLLPLLDFNGNGDYSAHVFDGEGAYANSSIASDFGQDKVANLQLSILRLFGSTRTSWGTEAGLHYSGENRTRNDARSNQDNDLIDFSSPGRYEQYRS
ncbi:MAG: hypothetical protein ACRBCI_09735 [Cellvibrionaceae bacterium]